MRYFVDRPIRTKAARPRRDKLDERVRLMIVGLCISTLFLLIRCAPLSLSLFFHSSPPDAQAPPAGRSIAQSSSRTAGLGASSARRSSLVRRQKHGDGWRCVLTGARPRRRAGRHADRRRHVYAQRLPPRNPRVESGARAAAGRAARACGKARADDDLELLRCLMNGPGTELYPSRVDCGGL